MHQRSLFQKRQVHPAAIGADLLQNTVANPVGFAKQGFLTVSTTGTLTLGWVNLAADGKGGVKKVTSGGVAALVVSTGDTGAVICL